MLRAEKMQGIINSVSSWEAISLHPFSFNAQIDLHLFSTKTPEIQVLLFRKGVYEEKSKLGWRAGERLMACSERASYAFTKRKYTIGILNETQRDQRLASSFSTPPANTIATIPVSVGDWAYVVFANCGGDRIGELSDVNYVFDITDDGSAGTAHIYPTQ